MYLHQCITIISAFHHFEVRNPCVLPLPDRMPSVYKSLPIWLVDSALTLQHNIAACTNRRTDKTKWGALLITTVKEGKLTRGKRQDRVIVLKKLNDVHEKRESWANTSGEVRVVGGRSGGHIDGNPPAAKELQQRHRLVSTDQARFDDEGPCAPKTYQYSGPNRREEVAFRGPIDLTQLLAQFITARTATAAGAAAAVVQAPAHGPGWRSTKSSRRNERNYQEKTVKELTPEGMTASERRRDRTAWTKASWLSWWWFDQARHLTSCHLPSLFKFLRWFWHLRVLKSKIRFFCWFSFSE